MKSLFRFLLAFVIALILGIGSALFGLRWVTEKRSIQNGAWRTNLAVGSSEADMYTRAAISVVGLFALKKSEAVYYIAETDDDGEPFLGTCDYRIEGRDLEAGWWSITLYGSDHFLVPNDQKRYSFNGKNVERGPDGTYTIAVSESPKKGNWLPNGGQDFSLTLRLYNPEKAVYENPGRVQLPRITKESCR